MRATVLVRPTSGEAIAVVSALGVICHESPHLSLHQPQALSWPPLPTIAFQRRSVSAWSSVATWNENASLCLNIGPPFRPRQGMPITVNSTVNTSPFFPDGKSPGARWTAPTDESGKVLA